MRKTFDILIDLENQTNNPVFTVSQNDLNTIEVDFVLTQDGQAVDLTGTLPRIAIKKPSGMVVIQDCSLTDAVNGKFNVTLSSQAYVEFGQHTAELYVYKLENFEVAVTGTFTYNSRSSLLSDDTLQSNNDFQSINNVLLGYILRSEADQVITTRINDLVANGELDFDEKPVLVMNNPTGNVVPDYVGQMALDTVGKKAYISTGSTNNDWQDVGSGASVDLTNYYTKADVYSKTETDSSVNAVQANVDKKFDKTGGTVTGDVTVTGFLNATSLQKNGLNVVTNAGGVVSIWTGTKASYDAITTKSSYTIYVIVG